MLNDQSTGREARQSRILRELLRERGIERYGLFLVTGEGQQLSSGGESASGYVVDTQGSVFFFWLEWDETNQKPAFSIWRLVEPTPEWLEEPEYREALEVAGAISPQAPSNPRAGYSAR